LIFNTLTKADTVACIIKTPIYTKTNTVYSRLLAASADKPQQKF